MLKIMQYQKIFLLLAVAGGMSLPVFSGLSGILKNIKRAEFSRNIDAYPYPAENPDERASADLETIRTRIITDLMAPAVDDAAVAQLIKTIKPDGSWPGINYQDVSRTGFQHKDHLENMLAL